MRVFNRIDTSKAQKVRGVVAVLTRDDILHDEGIEPYYGPVFKDQTIVAVEKVRHVGDPVAAVAALTVDAAEEALKLIEVDYEELPAVLNVHDAVKIGRHPGARFGQMPEFRFRRSRRAQTGRRHQRLHSLQSSIAATFDKGFAEAEQIFEDTFTLPATQHCFLETHACIASVEPGGRITVWATTQNPFVVRTQLANIFKVPVAKVRVIVPYLGGGYGGKVYPKVEPITVALAQKAGRPVRVVLSREEVFYTITKHAAVIRMKTGVKKDGTLVARECEIHLDTGAYAEIGPRVAKKSGYTAAGPYRIPNLKIDSYSVYTNKPPAGAFRGFGVSQSAWAVESQMDIIAAALKIDPLELRKQNGYNEGDKFVTGRNAARGRAQRMPGRSRQVDWMGRYNRSKVQRSKVQSRDKPSTRQGFGLYDQGDDHAVDLLRGGEAQRGRELIHICGYGGDGAGFGDGAGADCRERAGDSAANDSSSRRRYRCRPL